MIEILLAIKSFLEGNGVKIDNIFFRILTKYSTVVFSGCFLVNVVCLYFTEPISCISDSQVENVIDTYCWIKAMYTLPANELDAHPGVRQEFPNNEFTAHRYYQFIYIVLFLQAIASYLPRVLWRVIESNQMSSIADVVGTISPLSLFYDESDEKKNRQKLANFIHDRIHHNKTYAAKYFMCEIFAIFNAVFQSYLISCLAGGNFYTYGINVLSFAPKESFTNPLDASFPKVTKCTFKMHGPTGNIVPYDALCVLPINIANEKIYFILWVWFAFLFLVSLVVILYRSALFCNSKLRIRILKTKIYSNKLKATEFQFLAKQLGFSDWFYLNLIKENTPEKTFTDIIRELCITEILSRQADIKQESNKEN